jgi:hypothetical protein
MTTTSLSMPRRRPRGRPPAGATREERLKHIRAAYLLGKRICSARGLAAHYGVTKRTIYRWSELALTYEDDEAEGLRRLVGKD